MGQESMGKKDREKKKAAFESRFPRLLPSTSLQRGTSDTNHLTCSPRSCRPAAALNRPTGNSRELRTHLRPI